jgi:hypothetical protein
LSFACREQECCVLHTSRSRNTCLHNDGIRICLASIVFELSDSTRTYGGIILLASCDARKWHEAGVGRRKFPRDDVSLDAWAAARTRLALDHFACCCDARTDGEDNDTPDWSRHSAEWEEVCGIEERVVGFL